jgi:4-azaleucine resistance transporter AzlC
MQTRSGAFWAGVRAEIPLLVGVFPFGMIYGTLALSAGLSPAAAQSMSWIVFAGSSQFIAAQLLHESVPAAVIVLTIGIVNLRHMLYSASVAPYVERLSPRWKALLAYLLTDEAYAVVITNYQKEGLQPFSHLFFLGAGLTLWSCWQISTAAGLLLGTVIPESWPLDFALPVTFIALLMPVLKDRAAVAAALTGGAVAVVANGLPYRLGLIAAALVGIAAGILVENRK